MAWYSNIKQTYTANGICYETSFC